MNNNVEILVVEDSPAQARYLRQLLEKHDYAVSIAYDGQEALTAIHQHRPTMVISDVVMPRMDGYELCRRIKADESLRELPVILLTQLSEPEDVIKGLECGADNFMTKPYNERLLLSRIQYILANLELRRSAMAELGLGIVIGGQHHFITASRMQILDLLISTYDSAIQKDAELRQANTQLRQIEAELRRLNEELESRVARRTAELEESNLRLRQEIAGRVRVEEALRESEERFRAIFDRAGIGIGLTDWAGRTVDANPALQRILGYSREEMLGLSFTETTHPDDVMTDARLYEELVAGQRDHYEMEKRYCRKDGSLMWGRLTVSLVRGAEGEPRFAIGMVEDITERKQAEEALQRSLEETARGHRLLLALSQAAQAVQRARTPEEVYHTIGDEVSRLGYHAAVFTLTEDRTHLTPSYLSYEPAVLRAAEKLAGLSAHGYRFPLVPGGLYQRIIAEGKAVFREPTREFVSEALPAPLRPLAGRLAALLGLEQSIIAPLVVGGEPHGLLAVGGTNLSEADVPAVSTFANQAAIALENARLLEAEREQRAQLRALTARLAEMEEEERRRLARELHDRVGQNLTALSINLNIVRGLLPDEAVARLDDSLTLVEETAERIRDVMGELRPSVLDDYGLLAALHWYVERFSRRTDVTIQVQGEEPTPRLPPAVETALFRIAQEALTNVAKHAQATQTTVTLEPVDGGARLTIADDGVGFDPTALQPSGERAGWGVLTMRERAEAVGGHLRVESAPGEGTRITVEVPK